MFCLQKNKKEIPERQSKTVKIPPRLPDDDVSGSPPPHISMVASLRSSVYLDADVEIFLGAFGIAQ